MDASLQDTLLQSVQQVVTSLYGHPAIAGVPPDGAPHVMASIELTGAWHGQLCVQCCEPMMEHTAEQMLGAPMADPEILADAWGELANWIAGAFIRACPDALDVQPPQVHTRHDNEPLMPTTPPCADALLTVPPSFCLRVSLWKTPTGNEE